MTIVTSSEMSGLIAQQQGMFYNQAVYAQQVSNQIAPGGYPNAAPMDTNAFSYGAPSRSMAGARTAKIAGGVLGAAPGVAAAGGMLGSLALGPANLLNPMAWADPFSMAFAGGSAGMALGGAAGLSGMALAGPIGLGAAAGAGAGYAGYKALKHVTGNIHQGMVQNTAFQEQMGGSFNFGTGAGRGFGGGALRQIEDMVRAVDKADPYTSFGEITRIIGKMEQQGMMMGVTNVQQFEQRFKEVMETTKKVAQLMGTTMQEALPFVGDIRRSGFYTSSDIMGNTLQRQVHGAYGFTGGQFTSTQRQGAALSQAYGGTRRMGARMATRHAQEVSEAVRLGIVSDDEVMEATGGVGGTEGQAMLAQRFSQQAFRFTTSAPGRAMLAATGEIEGGRYTGRVDDERMAMMRMGLIDVGNLRGEARGRLAEGSGTSFIHNEGKMRGEFAEQHGMDALYGVVRQAAGRSGLHGQDQGDVIGILMKRFSDLSRSEADIMVKMAKDYERIQRERGDMVMDEMDRLQREKERRMYHSWDSLKLRMKDDVNQALGTPELQASGSLLSEDIQGAWKSYTDDLYGRYSLTVGQGAAQSLASTGTVSARSMGGLEPGAGAGGTGIRPGVGDRQLGIYNKGMFGGALGSTRQAKLFMKTQHRVGGTVWANADEIERFEQIQESFSRGEASGLVQMGAGEEALLGGQISRLQRSMGTDSYTAMQEGGAEEVYKELMLRAQDDPSILRGLGLSQDVIDQKMARRGAGSTFQNEQLGGMLGGVGAGRIRMTAPEERDALLRVEEVMRGTGSVLGGRHAVNISESGAARRQGEAVTALARIPKGGRGAESKARAMFEDVGTREGFLTVMNSVNSVGDFKAKVQAIRRKHGESNATGSLAPMKKLFKEWGVDVSEGQAQELAEYFAAAGATVMSSDDPEEAWNSLRTASLQLELADVQAAGVVAADKIETGANILLTALEDMGGLQDLQERGVSKKLAAEIHTYATGAANLEGQGIDALSARASEANRLAQELSQMAPGDRSRALALLGSQGGLGTSLAYGAMLYAGTGTQADDIRGIAGRSKRKDSTVAGTLAGLSEATGIGGLSMTGDDEVSKVLSRILGETSIEGEGAGVMTKGETDEFMNAVAEAVAKGVHVAEGEQDKAVSEEMLDKKEFYKLYADASGKTAQWIDKVDKALGQEYTPWQKKVLEHLTVEDVPDEGGSNP